MAGFRKAKPQQAALKVGLYGPPGSGKTFTTLLLAEGLAKQTGKRVAFVDTERGTDFYAQAVPSRKVHPAAFDFDALYTRSLTETLKAVKDISADEYSVIVLDSVTHLWEAAIASYNGPMTRAKTIPMHAWGKIKRPYKELMAYLLSSPLHVFILGRQGTEYETNEETEELKAVGYKMKAEGETAYEPHILIRMEAVKPKKTNEVASIVAYAEKDRTGVLAGRSFINPTFDTLCKPLLGLLGDTQAQVATGDATAAQDAEALAQQEAERAAASAETLKRFSARIDLADTIDQLKAIGNEITAKVKAAMVPADVATLRARYGDRDAALTGKTRATQAAEEPAEAAE